MADRAAVGGTLVLGGGFAGGYVARLLGKHGATIVSPENFMLYTPMLPEAASGTLEPRHVVVPLRMMCPHAELLLGRATAVDTDRRQATVQTEEDVIEVGYSNLVVALGAVSRTLPIPGLAEHALGFKSLADAIYLRTHVLRRLEAAASATTEEHQRRELTFVFIGAGYAGVEALAELADLVRDALRYYPVLREVPQHWVLVDAAPKILPEIPPSSATTPRARSRGAGSTSASPRRWARSSSTPPSSRTAAPFRPAPSSGPRAYAPTRSTNGSGFPSTTVDGSWSTPRYEWKVASTSGRWATVRASRTRRRRGSTTGRPVSTPSGKPAGWRRT
jgi:Pyridine nucleotide-disulphide oxidoreductase